LSDGQEEQHICFCVVFNVATANQERRWIHDVIMPSRAVVFCDTDALGLTESRHGEGIRNATEANVVQAVADALLLVCA
jgi:hypothetical protein